MSAFGIADVKAYVRPAFGQWGTTNIPSASGVIVETESSVRNMEKRPLFRYKKIKKGFPNLTSPYVHRLFFLIKQIFEKKSNQGQRPEVGLSFNLK